MKRTAEYRNVRKEYMEMINYQKDLPIRKNKKEKEDFIMQEIKSIKENGPISYIDKIRYDMLLKKI